MTDDILNNAFFTSLFLASVAVALVASAGIVG